MNITLFPFLTFFSFTSHVFSLKNDPYNFRFSVSTKYFNSITISWSTKLSYTNNPEIKYSLDKNNLNIIASGYSNNYINTSFHHHVTTYSLNYSSTYFFKAGNGLVMGDIKNFTTMSSNYPLKIAIIANNPAAKFSKVIRLGMCFLICIQIGLNTANAKP